MTPGSITSGVEPQRQATTGVPQAIASIITRPKGSGQSIGNSSASAPPRNADFCAVADLADELDQRIVQQRLDLFVEIGGVGRVDLGGDLQRHAQPLGDGDGPVGALLRRDAAQEGQIAAGVGREPVELRRACHGGRCRPSWRTAGAGAGRWRSRPAGTSASAVDRRQVLEVEPPVQGGQRAARRCPRTRGSGSCRCGSAGCRTRSCAPAHLATAWRGARPGPTSAARDPGGSPGRAPATSCALVLASALENSITSCPWSTRASHRWATTRSVPPYSFGGTAS